MTVPDASGFGLPPDPYGWITPALQTLHKAHRHRTLPPLEGKAGPEILWQGRSLANFASNDYLGLAGDPRLATAAIAAIHTYGTGSTGSRLLSGHRPLHDALEQAIAQLKGTEAALVFSSGYSANLGTIAALVGSRDLILADQYNHSSLINGARLSGAQVVTYPHGEMTTLAQHLAQERPRHRRCLILTDSVFSMDGDLCPLPQILDLADHYGAMVLVDEAHGTGVLGATGGGGVEHLGCRGRALIQVGTLSKALGSLGGYVAGSAPLIDFLRNRAPSWIYTTGLSPAAAAAALAAIQIVQQEPQRRDRLWQHRQTLAQGIDALLAVRPPGHSLHRRLPSDSPILCVEVTDAAAALAWGDHLRQAGILVAAVRPPTVPTSRLRITLMATHTHSQIQSLLSALVQGPDQREA